MSTIVTRSGKGSPLTHNEVDTNFSNLNTDKIQSGNTVAALTITALTTPSVQAVNSAGLALKNSAGTTQMSMGAGGGDNMAINVSTNLNGTNAQIDISPTGTGHVHIKPTGVNSVEIAPTYVGEMDNITIGAATAAAGSFTNLSVTGTVSFNGAQGTAGQVLTSAGTGATPTWASASSLSWQSVQTSNFTAASGNGYPINTTSAAITVTFPASPTAGNTIVLTDYAGTWATNNVIINPNGNKIISATTNLLLQVKRESVSFVYIDATQGWLPYSGFQDAVPVPNSYSASYLVVAGGGGGAATGGGGGGAGGLLSSTSTLNVGTSYTVTVGAGGAGGPSTYSDGVAGSNSVFGSIATAIGGGKGGTIGTAGGAGGSGGGGGKDSGQSSGAAGTSGQGNAGGFTTGTSSWGGSGGGGAGAVGGNGGASEAVGNGGNGTASSITGSSVTYAGGGAGGTNGSATGTGGTGGGGGSQGGAVGTAGTTNLGGGGGGGAYLTYAGGAGGSGVVILSVPTAKYSGTTTGSPTITTSGSNTIIKFTSSGSYTA
jgi:hypothetical protein